MAGGKGAAMPHSPNTWSEARVERLKALDRDGYSFAEMARELSRIDPDCGPITRNAVCGKLNRMRGKKYAVPRSPKRGHSPWTKKRLERLLEQEIDGTLKHSEKAQELNSIDPSYGCLTAHAVNARLQRMRPAWQADGLLPMDRAPTVRAPRKRSTRMRLAKAPPPPPETAMPFRDLEPGQCKWILNDPQAVEGPMACGAPVAASTYDGPRELSSLSRSYCCHHLARSIKKES